MMMTTTLTAEVSRGKHRGEMLYPHRHGDGRFVVSPTRYRRDYVRVATLGEVRRHLDAGMRLRMSNPGAGIVAASLVCPDSIRR